MSKDFQTTAVGTNDVIAVWFSCGAASAVTAKKTIELYGDHATIRVINNPVVEEDDDNRRFLHDVEEWLCQEIETAVNPKYQSCSAVDVWQKRQYMSGVGGAPCTLELKKEARKHWEKHNHADHHVLGFTIDEKARHERFILTERPLLPVLIDLEITKADCFNIIRRAGIELPRIYSKGFPNANCIGCVKATSPTYWNLVRKTYPAVFEHRARQSREIGARLVRVKNERKFLDELLVTDKGRPIKNLDFECGIFCEEWKQDELL